MESRILSADALQLIRNAAEREAAARRSLETLLADLGIPQGMTIDLSTGEVKPQVEAKPDAD